MNAPLPSIFFRLPSERDQTIMRPPGNDEFCLQVPNSSDYLIPLPGPRSITERLLSEGAGVTLPETMTTCSAPIVTSPSTQNQHSSQHQHSDENGSGCWETSFTMPTTNSNENLLQNDCNNKSMNGIDGIIMNHNSHNHHHHHHHQHPQQQQQPAQYSPSSRLTTNTGTDMTGGISVLQNGGSPKTIPIPNGCSTPDDHETRLISLDTPQPTPTTIKPPMSFAQLDGITLDPAALTKGQSPGSVRNMKPQAYANIQMAGNNLVDHHNGSVGEKLMNGNLSSGTLNGSSSTISANSVPFTIQGFNDRYINKDNHSEISC